jgi:hypothetical protein
LFFLTTKSFLFKKKIILSDEIGNKIIRQRKEVIGPHQLFKLITWIIRSEISYMEKQWNSSLTSLTLNDELSLLLSYMEKHQLFKLKPRLLDRKYLTWKNNESQSLTSLMLNDELLLLLTKTKVCGVFTMHKIIFHSITNHCGLEWWFFFKIFNLILKLFLCTNEIFWAKISTQCCFFFMCVERGLNWKTGD